MDKATIDRAFVDLDARHEDFQACTTKPTIEEAQTALDALRARLKRRYRELALEWHPDRTGGDKEKAARFVAVAAVWADIERLKLTRRPQPVLLIMPTAAVVGFSNGVRISVFYNSTSTSSSTTTNAATSASWPGWPRSSTGS